MNRDYWIGFLNGATIALSLVSLLFAYKARADYITSDTRYPLMELQEAKFRYDSFLYGRDPNFVHGPPKDRIGLNIDTKLLRHIDWNSFVHGTSDNSQYRWIGLKMSFGLNISDYIQFGYNHHSQHILDAQYPHGKYPVEDTLYIDILIFTKNKRDGIF